nr:hypothetical protein [Tanacetum cinerariifolium]
MARLQFCDYHNMVAILENGEFNIDFHLMVDFIAASPLRYALTVKPTLYVSHIRQFWSSARIDTTDEGTHNLATVDGIQRTGEGSGTPSEPHHTPFPEVETSHPTTSSIPLPSIPTAPIPTVTQPDPTPIRQYSRRARIAQSSALLTIADEPASLVRDVSKREACPTEFSFLADQDRATIAKTSTLPHDLAPRVTSPAADEGKDKEGVATTQSGEDAPIKGRSNNEGEAAAERISNDSEEIARVLTSMDAATVLAGEIDVPTDSGFIPTVGPPATVISTGSEVGPTASLIVIRRKGKEVMVESDTPKKKKLQEQIDAQVEDFIPMGSKEETERLKRKGLNLEKEQLVPVEDVYVQALQLKHPIIDWKVHSEGQRSYWQIIRLGGSSACYQFFVDLLRQLDRENYMHAPVEWKLYDLSGVHHVAAKDKEIFKLVEKDYPLRRGLALVMISYKLQVED